MKGLSKDALTYGIGNAIGRFLSVFTAPILTCIFVPSDYGALSLVQTMVNFFVMFAGFNLNSGTYFYYFYHDDAKDRRTIVSTSLVFYLLVGLLFSVIIWIGAPFLSELLLIRRPGVTNIASYDYVSYIRILSVGVVFSMLDTNFRSLLRMTRQPSKYMLLSIIEVILGFGLIILLVVVMKMGIEGALWAGVITTTIIAMVGFSLVVEHYTLAFSTSFLLLFLTYCLPQFPSVFLNWGLSQSNRFFLNYYASLEMQGLYSIALKIASVFILLTTAFRLAWDPFALSIMKDDDAKQTYRRAYTLYTVGFGFLGGCIALIAKPILFIVTPEAYHAAYSIIFILVATYLYQGGNNIVALGIGLSKKTKYISYAQVITFASNIALNFLLIPKYSARGAAMAFLGGAIVQSLSYYYFAQKVYPIPYDFWRMQLFSIGLFVIMLFNVLVVQDINIWLTLLTAVFFGLGLAWMAWHVGLDKDERHKILSHLPAVVRYFRVR